MSSPHGADGGDQGPPDHAADGGATQARPMDMALASSVSTLRVSVIEGPDTGTSLVLDPSCPSRTLVGTGPACEFVLQDPTVSRRHLAFEPVGKRYRITDLGSTNGTFVDGVAVVDAFVRGGEVVRCGATAMRLDPESRPMAAMPSSSMGFGSMLGASEAMRRLYPLCERLAAAKVPVLIEGETGTGKEVLAESLHEVSGRTGPFVVFDCTAISPTLVEAELFGHERGAFTGATAGRPGVLEQADGGTLLIDEIGELDPSLQPKLLRAADRGEFRRVGGRQTLRFDVRILAATRRDLDREVASGRFRDDLFHRLAIGRIELPPLRERKGDVTLLARHFAEQLSALDALTPEVLARFEDYAWPGNVRELRNAVARRVVMGDVAPPPKSGAEAGERAADDRSDFAWLDDVVRSGVSFPEARRLVVEEFERRFVEQVLAAHGGSVTRAAEASGIAPRYFRLIKSRRAGSS
jgi:DNA-binding NtrC family response regulator